MFKMTEYEQKIYAYLQQKRNYVTPSAIGHYFGGDKRSVKDNASWTARRCRRLIDNGYVIKNYFGQYKAAYPDENGFTNDHVHASDVIKRLLYKMKPSSTNPYTATR